MASAPLPSRRARWGRRLLRWGLPPLAGVAGVLLTAHKACDLVYGCGCDWVWAGGVAHCNIHNPLPPYCPVCTDPQVGALFAAGLFAAWVALAAAATETARRVLPDLSPRR